MKLARFIAFTLFLSVTHLSPAAVPPGVEPFLTPSCEDIFAMAHSFRRSHSRTFWEWIRRHPSRVPDEVKEANDELLAALTAPGEVTGRGPSTVKAIDRTQADALYRKLVENPVATLANIKKYDPDGQRGLCYGRAVAAQLTAQVDFKIDRDALSKVWFLGDLSSPDGGKWQYHVATMVRSTGPEGYWVIDPIVGRPLPVKDWHQHLQQRYDRKKTGLLFATDVNHGWIGGPKVGKQLTENEDPYDQMFFDDLLQTFQRHQFRPLKTEK